MRLEDLIAGRCVQEGARIVFVRRYEFLVRLMVQMLVGLLIIFCGLRKLGGLGSCRLGVAKGAEEEEVRGRKGGACGKEHVLLPE